MSARGREGEPPTRGEVQQAARDQFSKNGGEILDRENQIKGLHAAIHDAYCRIGTYIADSSDSQRSDKYVQDQIKRIRAWQMQLNELLKEQGEGIG